MNRKEQAKREIAAMRDEFRAVVGDAALDTDAKWSAIRERIKKFRQDAALILSDEECGVVAHDRRAKLAAFACEYAAGYYETQARAAHSAAERDACEVRLGDLARYLAGIRSVPRAAPQLKAKEAAMRAQAVAAAVRHYDAVAATPAAYADRMRRLSVELGERNDALPLLFTARRALRGGRQQWNAALALDAAVRRLAGAPGVLGDFAHVSAEILQAAASRSPVTFSPAAEARLRRTWGQAAEDGRDELVSVIAALVLVAFHTKALVPGAKVLCQQLLKTPRLHATFLDTFVEGPPRGLGPLLQLFVETTELDGQPLSAKARVLSSYAVQF